MIGRGKAIFNKPFDESLDDGLKSRDTLGEMGESSGAISRWIALVKACELDWRELKDNFLKPLDRLRSLSLVEFVRFIIGIVDIKGGGCDKDISSRVVMVGNIISEPGRPKLYIESRSRDSGGGVIQKASLMSPCGKSRSEFSVHRDNRGHNGGGDLL